MEVRCLDFCVAQKRPASPLLGCRSSFFEFRTEASTLYWIRLPPMGDKYFSSSKQFFKMVSIWLPVNRLVNTLE